jgi:hypothetical protein
MTEATPAYGLWFLVIVNSAVFILFAFSFSKPRTTRDWRSFGAFSAFVVALFTEMYGFPLTIYFLSGWLQSRYPSVDWFSHDAGHLLEMLLGWKANPHFGPFHLLSRHRRFHIDVSCLAFSCAQERGHTTGPYVMFATPICGVRAGHVRSPSGPLSPRCFGLVWSFTLWKNQRLSPTRQLVHGLCRRVPAYPFLRGRGDCDSYCRI